MSFDLQLAKGVSLVGVEGLRTAATRMVAAAEAVEALGEPLELCLRVTGDAEIRELNKTYRGQDAATDVLAFALREALGGEAAPHVLGDIVVSLETAERQRGERPLGRELEVLFAHGLCHLLGYDHNDDLEEAEMNARIASLLAAGRDEA